MQKCMSYINYTGQGDNGNWALELTREIKCKLVLHNACEYLITNQFYK